MNSVAKFIVLLPLLMILGCDNSISVEKFYSVRVENSDHIDEVKERLIYRYNALISGFFSKVEAVCSNKATGLIIFRMTGEDVSESTLQYLSEKNGKVEVFSNEVTWFTSSDIINAGTAISKSGGYVLTFKLREESGARMERLSRIYPGALLTMKVDNEVFSSFRTSGVLGSYFKIDIDRTLDQLKQLSIILKSGAINSNVHYLGNGKVSVVEACQLNERGE